MLYISLNTLLVTFIWEESVIYFLGGSIASAAEAAAGKRHMYTDYNSHNKCNEACN